MPQEIYIHYVMYKKWCSQNNLKECDTRSLSLFINNNY